VNVDGTISLAEYLGGIKGEEKALNTEFSFSLLPGHHDV
jgi:hypothetical protein